MATGQEYTDDLTEEELERYGIMNILRKEMEVVVYDHLNLNLNK